MDVALLAVLASGLGAWFWRSTKTRREPTIDRRELDGDADVALHVAMHNARSRQQVMSSLDLLYGLLQDESIASAVSLAGGDANVLEERVLGALAAAAGDELRTETGAEANQVLWIACMVARHAHRTVTCRDLWAYLYGTEAAALLDAERPTRAEVLFAAIHGRARPLPDDARGDVHVVLWNDDYTTQELVCELLRRVFGVDDDRANELMLETHHQGKSIVARLPVAAARAKIGEAQAIARAAGSPLHVGFEPV